MLLKSIFFFSQQQPQGTLPFYVHVCHIGKLLLIYESVLVMDLGSTSCKKKQPIHSWNWKQQRG